MIALHHEVETWIYTDVLLHIIDELHKVFSSGCKVEESEFMMVDL